MATGPWAWPRLGGFEECDWPTRVVGQNQWRGRPGTRTRNVHQSNPTLTRDNQRSRATFFSQPPTVSYFPARTFVVSVAPALSARRRAVIHSDRTGPDSGAIFSACTLRVGCPGNCEVRSAGPQAGRLAAYLDGGPACASVGALTLRAGLAHVPLGPNSSFLHHNAHNIGESRKTQPCDFRKN